MVHKNGHLLLSVFQEGKNNVINFRIGKQCRERWHNHLNPLINKNPWTQEEEWILFLSHQLKGNKWSEITLILQGRTDNGIYKY